MYNEAFDKFKKAVDINPNKYEALYNWGIDLGNLAKTKKGKEGEELYNEAFDKFKKAVEIKHDYYKAFNTWGNYLGSLAKTKEGYEAEELYNEAFDKSKKAIEYGGKSYNLSCFFALRGAKEEALKHLNNSLANVEVNVSFVEKDEDWKDFLEDDKFIKLLKKHKK